MAGFGALGEFARPEGRTRIRRITRRVRRVTAASLGPVLVAAGAVLPAAPAAAVAAGAVAAAAAASVATAPPAHAQSGAQVLVLDQNGEATPPEATLLRAAGYAVTQATPSVWAGMSAAQFEGYAALVIGDPSTSGSCSSLTPTTGTSGSDALGTAWQTAVSGNIAVLGTAPAAAGTSAANTFVANAVAYAAAGFSSSQSGTGSSMTGLYLSLNCDYATASAGTTVPLLTGVEGIGAEGGGITVQGGMACTDPGTVNTWEAASSATFGGFTSSDLATSAWGSACPVDETFGSWPAMFTPVAYDAATDVTANFTASGGGTGQPYALLGAPVSQATADLAPSAGGEVLGGTTAGGTSNPAAPGIQQAAAGDPVNTYNGDFTQSSTDLSLPGFGPQLAFTRTYDADTAQTETQTGTPGPLGYGWTDNWATSLAEAQPTPGDIYAAAGTRLDSGDGSPAEGSILDNPGEIVTDGSGNLFIADNADNRIQEVAGVTGNQWGNSQYMVAGDVYTVAGQADGAQQLPYDQGQPTTGGAPATSIVLNHPQGVTVDSAGDLFIADTGAGIIVEVPAHNTGSMQAGYAYTIAGVNGQPGFSTSGTPATSAKLDDPVGLHFGQSPNAGDLYIADGNGNRIEEIPATGETLWGQTMSAGDMYTVAGSASGTSGDSASTSTSTVTALNSRLHDPQSVTLNGSNMYIADSANCRIAQIPGSAGTQWGVSMKANDIYTVAGIGGSCGNGAAGGAARSTELSNQLTSVRDPNGNLYISDSGNSRVLEVAGPSSGQTANDIYLVEPFTGMPLGGLWMNGSNLYFTLDSPYNLVGVDDNATLDGLTSGEVGGSVYTLSNGGDGGPSYQGGLGSGPSDVATDSQGDVYIADTNNNRIQEIVASGSDAGQVVTRAGQPDGEGGVTASGTFLSQAFLDDPTSVAVDAAGDVFIAEPGYVQLAPAQATTSGFGMSLSSAYIYTIAGQPGDTGAYTGNGGSGTSATLGSDLGAITVDKAGDLFIADTSNSSVYEVPAASGNGMSAGDIYAIAGSAAFTAPGAPTGLTVTGTTSSTVSLSWTAPAGTVTGYDVYLGGTLLPANGVTATVSGTTAVVSGLSSSTSYTFTVSAVNVKGTGTQSASVQATTSLGAPAAPAGLTVTGTTTTTASLSWTAPSGPVSGYNVYLGGTELPANGVTATVSGTTAVVSGLSVSTSYTVTVQAYNQAGSSPQSAPVTATTSMVAPLAPTGLTVTGTTSSSVSLSWTAPAGTVTGYDVYLAGTELPANGVTAAVSGTTAVVSGLSASTSYTFTVQAYNSGGTSPQSSSVPATTPAAPAVPATPANLTATLTASTTVSLSWTEPSGTAAGYNVYEEDCDVTECNGTLTLIATETTGTSYTVSGLSYFDEYGFAVSAYNTPSNPSAETAEVYVETGFPGAAQKAATAAPVTGTITQALAKNTSGSTSGSANEGGPAAGSYLDGPAGLAIDAAGNIYISDSGANQVQEIAAVTGTQWGQQMTAGDIYLVAGNSSQAVGYGGDGGPASGPDAALANPLQIALDSAGDLYIADSGNSRVREVAAANGSQWSQSMNAGSIYSIAGTAPSITDTGNGAPASTTQLTLPYGVATDPAGDLYVLQLGGSDAVVFPELQEISATNAASIPADVSGGAVSSLYPLTDTNGGITVTQSGGSPVTFQPESSGGTCTAPYVQAQSSKWCVQPTFTDASLTNNSSGSYVFSPSPGSDTYTYATTPGSQGAFPLIAETDTAGEMLSLTQNTPAPGSGQCPSTASSCETIKAASGRTLVVGSNSGGFITSVTDPMGRSWTYQYNGSDQLTSATDPMTNVTSYTYGGGGSRNLALANDLLTITSPNGQPGGPDAGDSTVNAYDNLGRVVTQTDPMGWKTGFNYCVSFYAGDCMDPASGSGYVTVTDPDNNKTVYGYQSGTLTSKAQYTASISTPTSENDYKPLTIGGILGGGSLLDTAVTDGDDNTTTYTYDAAGDMTSTTAPSPDGPATATSGFDSEGGETCDGTTQASSGATCAQDAGPSPVAPGGAITPPSSAPPVGLTYTLYDTDGDELYSTTGVYEPGSGTASYLQTTYQLFNGNTVALNGATISCATKAPIASLPCATIDADGVVTQLGYDSYGDLISSSTPDGNGSDVATTTYSYDTDGEKTSVIAPDGNLPGANAGNYTTVTSYNADGLPTSQNQAGGTGATVTSRSNNYGYDADGNPTTVKDARGYTTTTTYNADDKVTLVTDPDGNATLTCYDGDGTAAQIIPPSGVAADDLAPASCPNSYPSGFSDRLSADATVSTYNVMGQIVEKTTPAPAGQTGFETTAYAYDSDGNLVQTTEPPATNGGQDQVTIDTYNTAGELASETTGYGTSAAATTSFCYNPEGQQTASVAPDGNANSTAPCETSSPWTIGSLAQAAYQTTYSYDSVGEKVSTTTPATSAAPNGATTTSTYDATGILLTTTDPDDVTTTYTYTPTGQTATISYSGSAAHSVTYTYDADGERTATTDATGASSYQWDVYGDLSSFTDGSNQTVTYGYDADGNATGITYPLPSTATWAQSDTVSYGYDNADKLTSVTDFNGNKTSISNNADGLMASEALGSTGDSISTSYDSADHPWTITLSNSSSTLQSFSYSDAPSGNILSESDIPESDQSPTVYTYDSRGRVATVTPGTQAGHNYAFDASGNLAGLPTGASATYDDASELTSSTMSGATTNYTYNADGEELGSAQGSTAVSSASWNGAGNLVTYADAAADMTAATYDSAGYRASSLITPMSGSPITESYVWNGNDLLMDSYNAYIYSGAADPDEQVNLSTGAVTYLVADSLGSVRGTVSSSGTLTGTTSYDAWGNPQTAGGLTSTTPFGFAGGYTDPDGLIYLINRYYNPAIGQFISVDPDVSQTQQPYEYSAGDPVDSSDPDGTRPCSPGSGCGSEEDDTALPPPTAVDGVMMGMPLSGFMKNKGHAIAVMGSYALITMQLLSYGYSSLYILLNLVVECTVPQGNKDGNTTNGVLNDGRADLCFDNKQGILDVWEVKAASYGSTAGIEAASYVRAYNNAGIKAQVGFALIGILPIPASDKNGTPYIIWTNDPRELGGPGGILYTVTYYSAGDPRRYPTPAEVEEYVRDLLLAGVAAGVIAIIKGLGGLPTPGPTPRVCVPS